MSLADRTCALSRLYEWTASGRWRWRVTSREVFKLHQLAVWHECGMSCGNAPQPVETLGSCDTTLCYSVQCSCHTLAATFDHYMHGSNKTSMLGTCLVALVYVHTGTVSCMPLFLSCVLPLHLALIMSADSAQHKADIHTCIHTYIISVVIYVQT
jgi:hypothetical protein